MKTQLLVLMMFLAVAVQGQTPLKVTQSIRYYNDATFDKSPAVPIATTNTGAVGLKQMRDSLAAVVVGSGSGTVTSVSSGLGLTGTVTTSGTLALDTANASVLSRQRAANTYQVKDSYLTSQTSHADVLQDGDFSAPGIMLRGSTAGSYSILTNSSSNWNTAYNDKLKWDGGATGLIPEIGRASLDLGSAALMNSTDFLLVSDTVSLSGYISGTNSQLAKFRGDSAVVGITNGSEGQVMKIVSGVPAWGMESGGSGTVIISDYTTVNDTTAKTGLKNITDLSLSLEANTTYILEVNLNMGVGVAATLVGLGINLSNTTEAFVSGTWNGTSVVATYEISIIKYMSSFNALTNGFFGKANVLGGVIFKGIVKTGATAPTLYIQYRVDIGIATVYPLSYVKATKI